MIGPIVFEDPPGNETVELEVVVFKIKNPLGQKRWETLLLDNEAKLRKEIHAWWMGWLRKLLPADIYRKSLSHNHEEFMEACRYIASHGIKFDNPGGRSFDRHVYNEGKVVGIFRIELVKGL